eukprot:scaffold251298_cov116-Cyclotella_meneghiniana.AAC.2
MDLPIKTHRRNMSARARANLSKDDGATSSKPRRSPLKRVFGGRRQTRSSSAPARIGRKHLLVEDHYRVDPVDKRLLPGLPVSDDDWARDMHDFFNLIALGFTPWVIDLPPFRSIRVKLISILFYITWITIRCILYPAIMKILVQLWWAHKMRAWKHGKDAKIDKGL